MKLSERQTNILVPLLVGFSWAFLWFLPIIQHTYTIENSWIASLFSVFFQPSTEELLVGKGVDLYGSFWMVEQVKNMVIHDQPSMLPWMYSPIGFDLGENTGYAWVDAFLGIPFAMWLGVPGFWNLHVYFVCSCSIASLVWMFRQCTVSWSISIGLALLCYTNPFMIDELNLGRPTQISIWPLALLVGTMRKQQSGFVWKHGILVGMWMAFACLTYWFTGIAMGVCMIFFYFQQLYQQPAKKNALLFAIVGIVLCCAIVLPITWDMTSAILQGKMQHSYTKLLGKPDAIWWFELPLQTIYTIDSWTDAKYVFKASCQHLPFFVIIVFSCFYPKDYGKKWIWVVLWLFTLGMSLSSAIRVFGFYIPTGLGVLEWIFPPMLRCQFEGRNVIVANMIGAIIVALTTQSITKHPRFSKKLHNKEWMIGFVCVLYAWMLLPTSKTLATTTFTPATQSNRMFMENPGGIIEFPYMMSNYTYIQQIFHKQPIFGGMGFDTVRPAKHKLYERQHPTIQKIHQVYTEGTFHQPLSKEDKAFLVDDGFRWVVIHGPSSTMPIERWRHFLRSTETAIEGESNWYFDISK